MVNDRMLDINYDCSGPTFISLAKKIEISNTIFFDKTYELEIARLQDGINILYSMTSRFTWLLGNPIGADLNQANTVIFSAIHKNLIALYSCVKLTRLGLYGPARSTLRHIFEALLIAKFFSVSNDITIYEKWKEGGVIYLKNGILKKISHPNIDAIDEFWGLMSEYSHATIYAQQAALNVQVEPDEVPLNLVYLNVMLDCLYHLVNRHFITPSMSYYANKYVKGPNTLPALRKKMRLILKETRAPLLPRPRQIISSYNATWKLNP
ncbi:hypothetical protein [Janthinobacterium sp. RA13]|uniref:hypothetical protein n=1 Tax=Janthinobacterium sp. RA13 TaxID=1502762 RepID=UPI001269A28F|nr:hypothetical protein [Janthinobacterium sp. RA13]